MTHLSWLVGSMVALAAIDVYLVHRYFIGLCEDTIGAFTEE